MSDEVIFALYHGNLMVDDPLPGLHASLEARGWNVTNEAGALRVSGKGEGIVTIAPRNSYVTVEWIVRNLMYPGTKVGERRAATLRKRQFDACLQLFVSHREIDYCGPLVVELPTDVQETLSAWLYLRWNRRWLFPASEKPPACFK